MRTGWGRRFASFGLGIALPLGAASPETTGVAAINAGYASIPVSLHAPRPAPAPRALISIIIDDLGAQGSAGLRTVNLPGAVACAFLPDGQFTRRHAELAHQRGKEVLLHLPLEPHGRYAHPTRITTGAGREQLIAYLDAALAAVPHVGGVNNHQGSLLTEQPQPMAWLMSALKERGGLYFVDSRTSSASVAYRMARERGVPAFERQVFLDNDPDERAIRAEFDRLIARALRDERALAIAHPNSATLRVLEQELPRLAQRGVRLVAPSELILRQGGHYERYAGLKISTSLNAPAK